MKHPPWLRKLFVRRMIIGILLLAQLAFIVFTIADKTMASAWLSPALGLFSLLLALHIISTDTNNKSGYRMVWVVLLLVMPVVGIPG